MAKILYFKVEDSLSKDEKFKFLNNSENVFNVDFKELTPNKNHVWLTEGLENDFELFPPLDGKKENGIFLSFSNGVKSNNDSFIFNSNKKELEEIYSAMVENYHFHYYKFLSKGKPKEVESILEVNEKILKWIRYTKKSLARGKQASFNANNIRVSVYRPFFKTYYNSDRIFSEELYQFPKIFPTPDSEKENMAICLTAVGTTKPFHTLMVNCIPDSHLTGDSQCFPFYTYNEDGTGRKENISDWALSEFRSRYSVVGSQLSVVGNRKEQDNSENKEQNSVVGSQLSVIGNRSGKENSENRLQTTEYRLPNTDYHKQITKLDIFYYIYAVLHKPEYREKYAANLRRSLPRIPMLGLKDIKQSSATSDAELFWKYSEAGKKLADLHLNYEAQPEYPLTKIESEGMQLDWRVEKMKYVKSDDGRLAIKYNDFLTLAGIPAEVKEYKLGNRSALDWIIDQYRVKTDKRSGITNDPFRPDEPDYIVRLIGKIVTVSLETMKIVEGL